MNRQENQNKPAINAYTRLCLHYESLLTLVNQAQNVFLSAIAVGELYAGFRYCISIFGVGGRLLVISDR
jgi:hypothetical protein